MLTYQLRNTEGHFIANIWCDRIEPAIGEGDCAFAWIGDAIVVGIGSRDIGVHVFQDGKEVVGTPLPTTEDFYPGVTGVTNETLS